MKPVLVGVAGHAEGQEIVLETGKTIVVGRSRSADFSYRRFPSVAALSDEERDQDHDLRTVSGKHFEVTVFSPSSVQVVNLSPNGTYIDGKRAEKAMIDDLETASHQIRIGSKEEFRLQMRADTAAPSVSSPDGIAEAAEAGEPSEPEAGPEE